jgi:hypothetical protein
MGKKSKKDITGRSISEQSTEEEFITNLKTQKASKYIRLLCWTDSNQSRVESHVETIEDAVRFIRDHSEFNANWSMVFRSETQPPQTYRKRKWRNSTTGEIEFGIQTRTAPGKQWTYCYEDEKYLIYDSELERDRKLHSLRHKNKQSISSQ